MAHVGLRFIASCALAVLTAVGFATVAEADPPPLVPIQGFLTDAQGNVITGAHDLLLSLYASDTSTSPLYTETHAGVAVTGGNFAVYLGESQALALTLFRDNSPLWLEVVVDGTEIIQPRVQIATAPYAAAARYCRDAATLGGNPTSAFALANHTHSFTSLTDIPPGLADGDNDLLATLTCGPGQVPKFNGTWGCGNDVDTDTLATLGCTNGQFARRGASAWGCTGLAAVASSGNFNDLVGIPGGLLTGAGASGYLPRYTGATALASSNVYQDGGGNVGIGTAAPQALLHVNGGIRWGVSALNTAQGGSIELGDSGAAATTPYMDFHYGMTGSQDYNVRIINDADGSLRILANTFRVTEASSVSPNIVMGYSGNTVTAGVVGAIISGGGENGSINRVTDAFGTVSGGENNTAGDNAGTVADHEGATVGGGASNTASGGYATVGGGSSNFASGSLATVGGGYQNAASDFYATVGGGYLNAASGPGATVGGGESNTAQGDRSFAAGFRAKANNQGCFVWGDTTAADVACNTNNAWVARTTGGVTFYTNTALTTGVAVAAGGGSWASVSDRNVKRDIVAVNPRDVLATLDRVPVSTWSYQSEVSGAKHMGPMAQDFHAAFGLGDSDKNIVSVDADGVALAAVEGLHAIAKEHASRIDALASQNAILTHENEELRARLDRLESHFGTAPASQHAGMFGGAGLGILGLGWIASRRRRNDAS